MRRLEDDRHIEVGGTTPRNEYYRKRRRIPNDETSESTIATAYNSKSKSLIQ